MWQSVQYYKALANPKRLAILKLLEKKDLSVGEIVRAMRLRQSNISQHLTLLRQIDLISMHRKGKNVFYQLKNGTR